MKKSYVVVYEGYSILGVFTDPQKVVALVRPMMPSTQSAIKIKTVPLDNWTDKPYRTGHDAEGTSVANFLAYHEIK